MTVKPLNKHDIDDVWNMDNDSGFYISQWEEDMDENNDYSWGIYDDDNKLIGYCSIGYADDVVSTIENHPLYSTDAYLLSDVYIKPEYRHNGLGLRMITEVIRQRFERESVQPVFLEVMYDKLKDFYSKAGFESINNTECMIYIPENHSKERETTTMNKNTYTPILSNPKHGWATLKLPTKNNKISFEQQVSYTTDVMLDALNAVLNYLTDGIAVVKFDAEGEDDIIVVLDLCDCKVIYGDDKFLISDISGKEFCDNIMHCYQCDKETWIRFAIPEENAALRAEEKAFHYLETCIKLQLQNLDKKGV